MEKGEGRVKSLGRSEEGHRAWGWEGASGNGRGSTELRERGWRAQSSERAREGKELGKERGGNTGRKKRGQRSESLRKIRRAHRTQSLGIELREER